MPKSKEIISESDNSGSSSEQEKVKSKPKKQEKKKAQSSASEASESEEEARSKKRTKKSNDDKGSNKKAKKETKSNNDEESWDIGGSKMVTVRSFRGKWYVDIREMYLDKGSGEMKPTKKGVFMNQETWKQLKNVIDEVDECLKSRN